MKTIILLLIFSFVSAQSDCSDGRYIDEIFDVSVQNNVQYGENENWGLFGTSSGMQSLYMNIYQPQGDNLEDRPLIFFLYGGAFVGGSKTSPDIVTLCNNYAKKGYVAVAIDYRLSLSLVLNNTEENAYRSVMKAIHDLKAAIRYFRMNDELYNDYRIDTERIYAGGVSAGAITAVNAAYLDDINEVPDFIIDEFNQVGGVEGNSGNAGYDSSFYGIVNLCGAVGDRDWIIEGDIPVVSMHGDQDDVVPYDDSLVTLFGLNIQIEGSYVIHQRMTELGNYSQLHTYEGQGHTPFTNMDFETDFTSAFLYDIVCSSNQLMGDVNGDGAINITDVVLTISYILSDEEPTAEQLMLADLNQDGVINVIDIILVVDIILGN